MRIIRILPITNNLWLIRRGELHPPMYEHKDFVWEDDLPNIKLIMVMDNNVNQYDKDAIISAFKAQERDFVKSKVDIGFWMSEATATTVKPFSSDWNPVYECIPHCYQAKALTSD